MAESEYAQLKANGLETARAIRNGQGVNNVDAHRIETLVKVVDELEAEKRTMTTGLTSIRDALREVSND